LLRMAVRDRESTMTHKSFLMRAICLAVASAILAADAASAATRGAVVSVATGNSVVRFPDAAYDPTSNVFLAVAGTVSIKGQWVSPAGAALGGVFTINPTSLYQQTPSTHCGENGVCLVVWYEGATPTPTVRLLSYSGGFLTGPIAIGPAGGNQEMAPGITYSPATHEFLVTWMGDYPSADNIWVARINLAGQVLASFPLTTGTAYERGPSVAYNPTSGEYVIAYEGMSGNVAYMAAQRYANGAPVGGAIILDTAATEFISSADYDSETQSVLVTWNRGGTAIYGKQVGANGAVGSLLTLSASYGAYDALGTSFNPISKSFLIVTHGSSVEDVAIEVSSALVPSPAFALTAAGGTGNFNPRVTANATAAQWLAVTSTSFTTLTAQFVNSAANAGAGGVPFTGGGDPPPAPPPPPPACVFSLAQTSFAVSPYGESGSLAVTTPAGCSWTAASNVAWLTVSGSGTGSGTVAVTVQPNPSYTSARSGTATIAGQTVTFTQSMQPSQEAADYQTADFNGDGKSDLTLFRQSTAYWYVRLSSTGATAGGQWGAGTDKPVPGDYDGDGKTDYAVYRPSTGMWYVIFSSTGAGWQGKWGGDPSDTPVPADYDGDGKTDLAIYRKSVGTWYIVYSSTLMSTSRQWGGNPSDSPVPSDYDGDGKTDLAVYRRSTGTWYVIYSSTGAIGQGKWGGDPSDIPVPADYDGDGKTDLAVYRKSVGTWYVIFTSTLMGANKQWGGDPSDMPAPGDYDGDGKTDVAVYRKSTGDWWILYSSTGTGGSLHWGGDPSDMPATK
jgi:hypothetical protein